MTNEALLQYMRQFIGTINDQVTDGYRQFKLDIANVDGVQQLVMDSTKFTDGVAGEVKTVNIDFPTE